MADSARRHRLAHLIVERRSETARRRPLVARAVAAAFIALLTVVSSPSPWALPVVLVAAVVFAAEARWGTENTTAAPGPVALRLLASGALVAVPAWLLTDVAFVVRALALAAALVIVVSVVSALLMAPVWFDPDARDRPALERLRAGAGALTSVVTVAVTVPADWPRSAWPVVWALALVPLSVGTRVRGLDRTVRDAVPLIQQEGQLGRDEVLREVHGALSTELRQLEQHARGYRFSAPELYERAVNANSSLRETLTLSQEGRDTSTSADSLLAPILTLTRAEGAAVTASINVERLEPDDREVARFVLNELVGDALRTGASRLEITVDTEAASAWIRVSVSDDGAAVPADVPGHPPGPPGPLQDKLAGLSGSLTLTSRSPASGRTALARWRGRS